VFAFNGESDSATAIDAATGKVAGTVYLGMVQNLRLLMAKVCLQQFGR